MHAARPKTRRRKREKPPANLTRGVRSSEDKAWRDAALKTLNRDRGVPIVHLLDVNVSWPDAKATVAEVGRWLRTGELPERLSKSE